MPLSKKELLMVGGGVLVVGVAAMYAMRNSSAASGTASPASPAASLDVPQMPVANIQPAPININETPTYQTINFPQTRALPKNKKPEKKTDDGCGCNDQCDATGLGVGATLNGDQVSNMIENMRRITAATAATPQFAAPQSETPMYGATNLSGY